MAFTVNKKAFCVLEFAKTESIVTVQRRFRIRYHTEPPTDKTIREWYMNSSRVAACALRNEPFMNCFVCRWFCVVMIRNLRCPVTIDSVLANSKIQNALINKNTSLMQLISIYFTYSKSHTYNTYNTY